MCTAHGNPDCDCGTDSVSELAARKEMKNSVLLKGLTRFASEHGKAESESEVKLKKSLGVSEKVDASDLVATDAYRVSMVANQFAKELRKYAEGRGLIFPEHIAKEIGANVGVFLLKNNLPTTGLFTTKAYESVIRGELTTDSGIDLFVSLFSPGQREAIIPTGGTSRTTGFRTGRGPTTGTHGTSEESVQTFSGRALDSRYPDGHSVEGRPFRTYEPRNPSARLPTERDVPVATYEKPTELVSGPGYQSDLLKAKMTSALIRELHKNADETEGFPDTSGMSPEERILRRAEDEAQIATHGDYQVPGSTNQEPGYPIDGQTQDEKAREAAIMDSRADHLSQEARRSELAGDWASRDRLLVASKNLRQAAMNKRAVSRFQGV